MSFLPSLSVSNFTIPNLNNKQRMTLQSKLKKTSELFFGDKKVNNKFCLDETKYN